MQTQVPDDDLARKAQPKPKHRVSSSQSILPDPSKAQSSTRDSLLPPSSTRSLNHRSDPNPSIKPSRERKKTSTKNRSRDGSLHSASIAGSNPTSLPSPPPPSLGFLKAARQLGNESTSFQARMQDSCGVQSPIAQVLDYWSCAGKGHQYIIILSVSVVVLLKASVSLGGYSGFAQGPLFGDLEAQRHWMGLTLHRRISEWYFYDLNCKSSTFHNKTKQNLVKCLERRLIPKMIKRLIFDTFCSYV